jgi:hypothetical protein
MHLLFHAGAECCKPWGVMQESGSSDPAVILGTR